MAWLSDLAGRAENILNKLDQNAATVLVQPQQPAPQLVEVVSSVPEVSNDPFRSPVSAKVTPKHTQENVAKLDDFVVSAIEKELAESAKGQTLTVEEELAATKIVLSTTKQERDDLKAELANILEHIDQKNNGRNRIAELERNSSEITERNRQLSIQSEDQLNTISKLQMTAAQLKQTLGECQEQLQVHRNEAERANNELVNYRTRAQALLQIKEQLIEDLRLGSGKEQENTSSSDQTEVLAELEKLRNENKIQSAELAELQLKFKESQEENGTLVEKLRKIDQEAVATIEKLKKDVLNGEKERTSLRQELSVLTTEMQAVRLQSNQSNEKLIQKLHDKDQEIAGLRKRTSVPQAGADSLDNRIKSLTQSLIQKQTSLETVTSDRNALKIQLEKLEAQFRSLQGRLRKETEEMNSSAYLNHSMLTDDDKAQLPLFMQETPFDNQVAKRVKRVIKASDSFLDRFLRRYPLLRVFLLFYVVVLHIWVMIVLMSSTPN